MYLHLGLYLHYYYYINPISHITTRRKANAFGIGILYFELIKQVISEVKGCQMKYNFLAVKRDHK